MKPQMVCYVLLRCMILSARNDAIVVHIEFVILKSLAMQCFSNLTLAPLRGAIPTRPVSYQSVLHMTELQRTQLV